MTTSHIFFPLRIKFKSLKAISTVCYRATTCWSKFDYRTFIGFHLSFSFLFRCLNFFFIAFIPILIQFFSDSFEWVPQKGRARLVFFDKWISFSCYHVNDSQKMWNLVHQSSVLCTVFLLVGISTVIANRKKFELLSRCQHFSVSILFVIIWAKFIHTFDVFFEFLQFFVVSRT